MNLKLYTAPTIEPVQLADVLAHSRLDSTSLADNVATSQSIAPGAHVIAADYSLVGTGVAVTGYRTVVNLNSGTNGSGGVVTVKIQESDDNVTYTDWAGGAFTQVTTANDNAVQEKEYTGSKPYVRTVATVAVATCDFGTDVIMSKYTPSDASYLTSLITAARRFVEHEVLGGVALITQTWEYYLDEFPETDYVELPRPPLASVSSVKYTKTGEAGSTAAYANTFSSTNYAANTVSWPGGLRLYDGASWPSYSLETNLPVKVTFVAGYTTRATVPDEIKQCILMYVDDLYEHRGVDEVMDNKVKVVRNPAADRLVSHYRTRRF